MENSYYYDDRQQGGFNEEYYDPTQGGYYYYDDCSNYSYPMHDFYNDETVGSCVGMVEEPRSKWEELLDRCISELEENKEVTDQRLQNLEINTGILERSLTNLCSHVISLEYNLGTLATALGSKHKPGHFPSLPEINLKGNCHAIQLRSGTAYEPPNPSDVRHVREEKTKEQHRSDHIASQNATAAEAQRFTGTHRSDPLESTSAPVPEAFPATVDPQVSGPPKVSRGPESSQWTAEPHSSGPLKFTSTATVPFPHRLASKKLDAQFAKFLEVLSKVHINIPLVEALQQMPNYARFLKDVVAKKRKWGKYETVGLTENCSAIVQKDSLPSARTPEALLCRVFWEIM